VAVLPCRRSAPPLALPPAMPECLREPRDVLFLSFTPASTFERLTPIRIQISAWPFGLHPIAFDPKAHCSDGLFLGVRFLPAPFLGKPVLSTTNIAGRTSIMAATPGESPEPHFRTGRTGGPDRPCRRPHIACGTQHTHLAADQPLFLVGLIMVCSPAAVPKRRPVVALFGGAEAISLAARLGFETAARPLRC
jgi:hypothetical protein